jgi:hypothetical protein
MLNLDQDIPGTRLYLLKKRGIFKTSVSRQKQVNLTAGEIAEIEYRFEALKPYLIVVNVSPAPLGNRLPSSRSRP